MKNSGNNMEDLFQLARVEKPRLSCDEVQQNFINTMSKSIVSAGTKTVLTLKNLAIMISITTIGIIAVYTLFSSGNTNSNKQPKQEYQGPQKSILIEDVGEANHQHTIEAFESEESPVDFKEKSESNLTNLISYDKNNIILQERDTSFIDKGMSISSSVIKTSEVGADSLKEIKKEEQLTKQCFTITEKSTEEEIQKIKERAEMAGIDFEFKIRQRRGSIKHFSLKMKLKDEVGDNDKFTSSLIKTSGKFRMAIKWRENEKGEAIDFDEKSCAKTNSTTATAND